MKAQGVEAATPACFSAVDLPPVLRRCDIDVGALDLDVLGGIDLHAAQVDHAALDQDTALFAADAGRRGNVVLELDGYSARSRANERAECGVEIQAGSLLVELDAGVGSIARLVDVHAVATVQRDTIAPGDAGALDVEVLARIYRNDPSCEAAAHAGAAVKAARRACCRCA
jgi:hypothetical protein